MNAREKIDKAKPFKLYKYVTFTSFIVIFVGTIVLSALNTHWAREMQFSQSEDYALLLVSNLNHQIFRQFVLPMSLKYGKIQLSETEQFERLDTIVRGTVHGFNVKNVNVYDLNNIISYSFDSHLVGKKNLGGQEYLDALERELNEAGAALAEARRRYRNGSLDYLNVLAALTSVQRLELDMLDARADLLLERIGLHRALGGAWTRMTATEEEETP